MKDTLKELVCEAIQEDDCIAHCNYPHCHKVNSVVHNLIKHNVIIAPCKVGDTVYYISGIPGRLVKPAKVEEIIYNGSDFTLGLVSENNIYFDMSLNEVYMNTEEAEEAAINGKHCKNK